MYKTGWSNVLGFSGQCIKGWISVLGFSRQCSEQTGAMY